MQLTFLGGASEVGASCTLLEVAGKRILVDAGIRMQARDGDPLPDLARLQEAGGVDVVLLTHAHTDHIGALPLVHLAYPRAPILATAPSLALMQILMADALKIMDSRWEREQEIPLYPPHAVSGMLSRVAPVAPGERIPVAPDVVATWTPSGHILGACSILLATPEGRVLFTGDYSVDRQRTVEGVCLPPGRPHLVVTEATYGNRMHAHRPGEEARLVEAVAEVVAAGGKVLIPAFAVGRAQEVLLVLLDAQRRGTIPTFPVYVDGLVKSVCAAYNRFPEFLERRLRKQVESSGNPFFFEGGARAVQPDQRQALLDGTPCVIVSSSGMLTGGPSQFYARGLAGEEKNAIFITGYQDEESPGRRLLDLAEGKLERLRMGGEEVAVTCRVAKYSLSAHADAAQILGVLSRLEPQEVLLVHGDEEARNALAAAMPPALKVNLPANGETFEARYTRGARAVAVHHPGFGLGAPLDLVALRARLVACKEEARLYTAQELATLWHGTSVTPDQVDQTRAALAEDSGFCADPRRTFLYRVRTEQEQLEQRTPGSVRRARREGRLEQNLALAEVDRLFDQVPDLYRKGAQLAQGELVLSFYFPRVARVRYAEKLDELARVTGWTVQVSNQVHQQELESAVRRAIPPEWELLKVPSVYPGEDRVRVKVRLPRDGGPEQVLAVQRQMEESTGHRLEVESGSPVGATPAPAAGVVNGVMEQNLAFSRVREAFQALGLELYRCGKKEDPAGGMWMEVSLISPQVAQRHEDLRRRLEQETGWVIRFGGEPNQDVIKRRVKELLPAEWGLKREPGFFKLEGLVRVKVAHPPAPERVGRLSEQFQQETGFRLEVAG